MWALINTSDILTNLYHIFLNVTTHANPQADVLNLDYFKQGKYLKSHAC